MATHFPSGKDLEASREWHIVNAAGIPVGRLATEVAHLLMGKHKPTYTPFLDLGDHVIVINASKVVLKGVVDRKPRNEPRDLLAHRPERVVEGAIKGMLPKTKLGKAMGSKLKVYAGSEHPHGAQSPKALDPVARPKFRIAKDCK